MREVAGEVSRSSEPSHWVARPPYRSRTTSPAPSPSGRPRPPGQKPARSSPQGAPNTGRRSGALRQTGSTRGPKLPSTAPLDARSRSEPRQAIDKTQLKRPRSALRASRRNARETVSIVGYGTSSGILNQGDASSTDAPTHPCSAEPNSPPSPSPAGKTDDSTPTSLYTKVELAA